MANKC